MKEKSLEDLLQTVGNPATMLRNSQIGAYVYPVVPTEYSNWRDEQLPGVRLPFSSTNLTTWSTCMWKVPTPSKCSPILGTNSFAKFPVNRAKQFSPCSYDGYVIGDGILFHLEENRLVFVGRAPVANWLQFHGETGGYNVRVEKDDRSPSNPRRQSRLFAVVTATRFRVRTRRRSSRSCNGGPLPEIKFFNMDVINIAGRKVRALRHGMAGAPGLEVRGPTKSAKKFAPRLWPQARTLAFVK